MISFLDLAINVHGISSMITILLTKEIKLIDLGEKYREKVIVKIGKQVIDNLE